jgi:hypothetical protein
MNCAEENGELEEENGTTIFMKSLRGELRKIFDAPCIN